VGSEGNGTNSFDGLMAYRSVTESMNSGQSEKG